MAVSNNNCGGKQRNRWRKVIWGSAACLLLMPFVAMRFTHEVNWDRVDFIAIGALLASACGTYELAVRMSSNTAYRAGFGVAIMAALLLVWINLAVGVIGSEDNRANLVFGGVLAVSVAGALAARLRPGGMARAAGVTVIAQVLATTFAAVVGPDAKGAVVSGAFAVMWLASALLFRIAARQQAAARAT